MSTFKRLDSLDILRGFDLFCLVILYPLLWSLSSAIDSELFNSFLGCCFSHHEWEGLLVWDMVMPLFLFMSGITIPFALNKHRSETNKLSIYKRILKRVVLLWILGMICQGDLLGLHIDTLDLYSNTLQAIAIGYLGSAILFLHCSIRTQIIFAIVCLFGYWGTMEFISVGGYGGGDYSPDANLTEWVDRVVLGGFRDGASLNDGVVVFSEAYRYTWILGSLNFVLTVLSGVFAGYVLKSDNSAQKRAIILFGIGISLIIFGNIMGIWHPIIKKITTSSFILVGSGYSFVFIAIFYYIVDVCKMTKYLNWLKIFGTNSILAYTLSMVVNFSCLSTSLLWGTEQYLGEFYPVIITLGNLSILSLILHTLYKKGIFLKV